MARRLTGRQMDALDYLWGGGDEVIECRKITWVKIRYPQMCMTIIHKGDHKLPAGTRMVRETAKVEGQFGTCYTCEDCLRRAEQPTDRARPEAPK